MVGRQTEQVIAEPLPLELSKQNGYFIVKLGKADSYYLWQRRGFELSQNLPYRRNNSSIEVKLPSDKSLSFWAEYGWANSCPLQWIYESTDGYQVNRSIINHGFWKAYKWWKDCQYWYLEKYPEWFIDMDWWGQVRSRDSSPCRTGSRDVTCNVSTWKKRSKHIKVFKLRKKSGTL